MNMISSGFGLENAVSPITIGGKVAGNRGVAGSGQTSSVPFGEMFEEALQNVQVQDSVKEQDSYNLAIGDLDDLGVMMENSTRAQTAFQLLVQMRNKMLDSYQEIMRINL